MKDFRIIFDGSDPVSLPDGLDVGVLGEHNAVQLVILLPNSMITGMDYHTVTVGDVESALITDTEANVDGAYRVGNTIYQPLTAAYTTQKFVNVFVTAYKQTDAVQEIVDKTPTVHGLHFSGGVPRPIPGGIAAQIAELQRKVDELLDGAGIKVVETLPEDPEEDTTVYLDGEGLHIYHESSWIPVTSDALLPLAEVIDNLRSLIDEAANILLLSQNADVLYKYNQTLVGSRNYPIFDGNIIGFCFYGRDPERELFLPEGTICCVPLDGLYYSLGSGGWYKITDANSVGLDYALLNKFSEDALGALLYGGKAVVTETPDDVTLLALEAYDALYLRDDFTGIGTLDDVPIYVLDNVSYGFGLYEDENNPSTCDSVSVGEVVDDDTGLPVRFVRAFIGGTNYARWSRDCTVDGHDFSRGVWYTNNTATDAPSLAGFTPTALEVCGEWYDDLSDLPDKAASALRSLSQLVNVSSAAMGTIRVPENAVQRFAGAFQKDKKYAFRASEDMTVSLPTMPWSDEDAQFVLYLTCAADIDVSFPSGTLFVGGTAPNTDTGVHKIIGSSVSSVGAWMIGGIDYEVPA